MYISVGTALQAEYSPCQGPWAGPGSVCWRNSQEAVCLEQNERGGREEGGKGVAGVVIQDLVGLREDWSFY